jgi:hypothetical protein
MTQPGPVDQNVAARGADATSHQHVDPGAAPSPEARQRLFQIALGGLGTQTLSVAARLGLADLLADGPRSCDELARSTGTHAPSLLRVMRALASLGVFTEVEAGRFGLTPLSACLRSDAPGSFRIVPIYLGDELYRTFGELLHGVETGERPFDRIYGATYFEYLAEHADAAQVFNEAMTALGAAVENPAVAAAYDFAGVGTVVDVGGGHGALLASILPANPGVKGVLFDQPAVVESARARIESAGIGGRCTLVAGDFFEAVPAGGDVYALKRIIHDWDDERSVAILTSCRRAMAGGGKLLVVEDLLPPGDEPSLSKLVDVVMMTILPGRERTVDEYRTLFRMAGFDLSRIVPTASSKSVIEGTPV